MIIIFRSTPYVFSFLSVPKYTLDLNYVAIHTSTQPISLCVCTKTIKKCCISRHVPWTIHIFFFSFKPSTQAFTSACGGGHGLVRLLPHNYNTENRRGHYNLTAILQRKLNVLWRVISLIVWAFWFLGCLKWHLWLCVLYWGQV